MLEDNELESQGSLDSFENIEAVSASMSRLNVPISDHSVRRVLHDDLHFHPYKVAIVQTLSEHDFDSRKNACEVYPEAAPEDAIAFLS